MVGLKKVNITKKRLSGNAARGGGCVCLMKMWR